MPDKKLTDNEIIKALEDLRKNQEDGYITALEYGGKRDLDFEKDLDLFSEALDLINRLQEDNERLQESIDEQDIEISRLYKRIDEAKAEAYKEFWNSRPERLNEQCKGREEYNKGWNACLDEFWEIRNNLFYELVGNNNAL